jgi:hypothetical protein
MGQQRRDEQDLEPLPTDGLQVEETRDADTVRRFLQEWRCRVILERAAGPAHFDRADRPRAIMRP